MNWKQEIRKKVDDDEKIREIISLKEEVEKAYQQESTQGVKNLLTKKIESMEEEWTTNMNELKNLL